MTDCTGQSRGVISIDTILPTPMVSACVGANLQSYLVHTVHVTPASDKHLTAMAYQARGNRFGRPGSRRTKTNQPAQKWLTVQFLIYPVA